MNKSRYIEQCTGGRVFEVATTALARITANKPVERLSQEQLAKLKKSLQIQPNRSGASHSDVTSLQPCFANHRK